MLKMISPYFFERFFDIAEKGFDKRATKEVG